MWVSSFFKVVSAFLSVSVHFWNFSGLGIYTTHSIKCSIAVSMLSISFIVDIILPALFIVSTLYCLVFYFPFYTIPIVDNCLIHKHSHALTTHSQCKLTSAKFNMFETKQSINRNFIWFMKIWIKDCSTPMTAGNCVAPIIRYFFFILEYQTKHCRCCKSKTKPANAESTQQFRPYLGEKKQRLFP